MNARRSPAESLIVPPGGVVGIVGGGQLGRMMAAAASRLGIAAHVYVDEAHSPASFVATRTVVGSFEDVDAMRLFAAGVDVLTYEFENVPAEPLEILAGEGVPVAPGVEALRTSQDRLIEKTFARSLGVRTAPFEPVDGAADILAAAARIGRPTILKTRRFGYDGKGQVRLPAIGDGLDETAAEAAWRCVGAVPSIVEGLVGFACEISVVAARSWHGDLALYDCPRNEHRDGILRRSVAPSGLGRRTLEEAGAIVRRMMARLDYVGVIAVEFFVEEDGGLRMNEFAPRVHNSGHWTEDACIVGQFEQHIRAVAGWPLGSTRRFADAEMINLIGDDASLWRAYAADPTASVRLYGKEEARAGRKMGHVTRLLAPCTPDPQRGDGQRG